MLPQCYIYGVYFILYTSILLFIQDSIHTTRFSKANVSDFISGISRKILSRVFDHQLDKRSILIWSILIEKKLIG